MLATFCVFDTEPRWLCWREEERDGKRTKIPYSARTGKYASATDPLTWAARLEAEGFVREHFDGEERAGIGIALGDVGDNTHLCGLDLDSSIDDDLSLAAWATPILAVLGTYSEISPSGRGLKAFFYAETADIRRFLDLIGVEKGSWGCKRGIPGFSGADHGPGIEVYSAGRYFTITEQLWSADHQRIARLDWAQLERLAALIPPTPRTAATSGRDEGRDTSRTRQGLPGRPRYAANLVRGDVEGLRNNPDPEIRQWVAEKGEVAGERELRRVWNKLPLIEVPPEFDEEAAPLVGDPIDHDSATNWAPPSPEMPWPRKIDDKAFHGLAGEVVNAIAPLLLHYLCMAGNVIGRKPYCAVGVTRHYPVINALLIGKTARARKGTARNELVPLFDLVDPDWGMHCQHSGLSSDEGLITCVHDEVRSRERSGKGADIKYVEVVKDPGVADKRAMIVETEFGGTLVAMGRDGNLLCRVIREFWDCQRIVATKTKNSPTKATDAHVSILGHCTIGELQRRLDFDLFSNGLVNRFLVALVKRVRLLPFGGEAERKTIAELARRTRVAIDRARQSVVRIGFTDAGRKRWEMAYQDLSRDLIGLVDDALARAEAQTARLAMLYCLLDCQLDIAPVHIDAALAVWRYCEASTRYLFGDRTGDPIADEILAALRQVAPDAMTRTDIYNLLGRNRSSERTANALGLLLRYGKVRRGQRPTSGRPIEIWMAV